MFHSLLLVGIAAVAQTPDVSTDAPLAAPGTTVVVTTVGGAPASASTVEAKAPAAIAPQSHTRFGMMLDVGIPDALGASFVYRPFKMLRLHGGLITHTSSLGIRAGVSFVPFYFLITPSVVVEAGRMFDGDLSFINRFGVPLPPEAAATQVNYNFVNGHVGFEIGSPRRFTFYLRAGLSYVDIAVANFQEQARVLLNDPSIEAQPAHLRFTGPSAKLGFLVYFM